MRDTDYFPMDKVLEMWALQSGEPQVNILAALASALIVEALAPWTFQRRGVEIWRHGDCTSRADPEIFAQCR